MEPYREDKPFIRIDTETSLLDRLLQAGIPFTRALKYYRDNPEGSALETLKLAAEDVVPFYGTYRNGGDIGDYAKEAAMLGVPIKGGSGVSTRARRNANSILRDPLTESTVTGPFNRSGTASNVLNTTGTTMSGTNTKQYEAGRNHGGTNGGMGWQGEMYEPGRKPVNTEMYGPFQWEDVYSRKLDNVIGDNENRWNFMINETRPNKLGTQVPKQDLISIALEQGRPDIADRIATDTQIRIPVSKGPKYASYYTTLNKNLGMDRKRFMDISNRAVEKELRETFATLPDDPAIRQRFADYYGVHDLYNDWVNNKPYWDEYTRNVRYARSLREAQNRSHDRKYGRNIER